MPLIPDTWLATLTVDTVTDVVQAAPRVTQLANGNILVAWTSARDTGAGSPPAEDVIARLFSPLGQPLGGEIRLNQGFSAGIERNGDIAALPDGGFVVVYQDGGSTGMTESIRIDRYDAAGLLLDGIDTIATTPSRLINPQVVVSGPTSALVTYLAQNGGDADVLVGHVYNPFTGTRSLPITLIGPGEEGSTLADVAVLEGGSYVVASIRGESGAAGVRYMLLAANGNALTGTLTVEGAATDLGDGVSVTGLQGGGFVLAWSAAGEIVMRLFSETGAALQPGPAGLIRVGDPGGGDARPAVVALADGGFLVLHHDTEAGQLQGRRFDATGAALGTWFAVAAAGSGNMPAIDAILAGDGRVVITHGLSGAEIGLSIIDPRDTVNPVAVYAPAEWQIGTNGNDTFFADTSAATVAGHDGNDSITARGAIKTYLLGAGDDRLIVGSIINGDVYDGGSGSDSIDWTGAAETGATFDLANQLATDSDGNQEIMSGFEHLTGTGQADLILGSVTGNSLVGNGGNDLIAGLGGDDSLFGGNGNDRLDGGIGNDRLEGGLGNDSYFVDSTGDIVAGEQGFAQGGGIDTVTTGVDFTAPENIEILRALVGVAGIDLTGNDAPGTLVGNEFTNVLNGRGGNDQINGNAGTDTLVGGEGTDTLVGGLGADTFIYQAVSNSRAGAANRDVLNGFDRGAVQDLIDLSAIDANSATALNDAFTFIGAAAFTAAGQVRFQSLGGPNAVIVEVNVNGDLAADMQIFVNLQTTMAAGDFIL